MKLIKIHRVLSFTQSTFLKKYIDKCTLKRQESKTDFGKRLWKLFSNSVFGKTLEQIRDYVDCKVITSEQALKKWVTNPRFTQYKIISDEIVLIFLKRSSVLLNKPISLGFTILERSKYFMYDQYYNVIKPKMSCEVLMSDTDSFILSVQTKKKSSNLKKLNEIMDYSNYPPHHSLYNNTRKNKLGFFSDELSGRRINQFCGLRSKTYAYILKERKNQNNEKFLHTKCKGVTKGYRKTISFQNYADCLKEIKNFRLTQYQIQAKNHIITTNKIDKLCFGSYDDKRYILPCGIHSVAYGHNCTKKKVIKCYMCDVYKYDDNDM